MQHSFVKQVLALSTIAILLVLNLPVPAAGQRVDEEKPPADSAEPAPEGLNLPGRSANVRDPLAGTPANRRIIQLDTLPQPPLPPTPLAPRVSRSSTWKWLAIGAGAAGAAVTAFVAGGGGGGVRVPLPGPGGTLTPVPIPTPDRGDIILEPVDPRPGNGNGRQNGNGDD